VLRGLSGTGTLEEGCVNEKKKKENASHKTHHCTQERLSTDRHYNTFSKRGLVARRPCTSSFVFFVLLQRNVRGGGCVYLL
jgi:hypothetical protein